MNVELVESWLAPVVGELNLELKLGVCHGSSADGALGSDTGTAPGPIRYATR
jgi:hypothetical protein